jgi:phenylacetate-CoA ligase
MGVATEAKRVLESLPAPAREALEQAVSFVPRPWLYGGTFRATQSLLARTERMPRDELQAWQDARIRGLVRWAHARVPYWRRVMDERGVRPEHVQGASDLRLLPFLTKEILRDHAAELLAEGVPDSKKEQVSTGGTSGEPLRFMIDRDRSAKEWAFMTWQWGRVGYRPGMRRAVLRGMLVQADRLHEWHPLLDELVLSTFRLSAATLPEYLRQIERYRPEFLHAYPSSAEHLARLLRDVPQAKRPRFRALLLGSENVYPGAARAARGGVRLPRLRVVRPQREVPARRGLRGIGRLPHLSRVRRARGRGRGRRARRSRRHGNARGTGFMNRAMPFLRYMTDDRATLVAEPCACGRAYPRLRGIEGRWHGERLFGDGGRVFSMTALNTHSAVFDRVARFRIRQERPARRPSSSCPARATATPTAVPSRTSTTCAPAAPCASPSSRSTSCP